MSIRVVRAVALSDEPKDEGVPLADGSRVRLPAVAASDELEAVEPNEIVVRVTDDRAIVFGVASEMQHARWGRWLAKPNAHELSATVVVRGWVGKGTSKADVIVVTNRRGARVAAGGGDDRVCGGPGRDRLVGGGGADRLKGAGRDVLVGGKDDDTFSYRSRRVRTDATAGDTVNGRRKELDAVLRQGTLKLSPGSVVSLSDLGGGRQQLVLRRGTKAPRTGGLLVIDAAGRTPDGVVGRVAARSVTRQGTRLTLTPASLSEAYKRFRVSIKGTLADPTGARAGARASVVPLVLLSRRARPGGLGVQTKRHARVGRDVRRRRPWVGVEFGLEVELAAA